MSEQRFANFSQDFDFSEQEWLERQLEDFYRRYFNYYRLIRTKEWHFQAKEIDLIIIDQNGGSVRVEEKFDRYPQTGNFALEKVSKKELNTPGWLYTTRSDYICYAFVDTANRQLACMPYLLPVIPLQEWFLKNEREHPHVSIPNRDRGGQWTTEVVLVPIHTLTKELKDLEESRPLARPRDLSELM